MEAATGATDLLILPGDGFQLVTDLITNFHLPKSSLLMLVIGLCWPRARAIRLPRCHRAGLPLLQLRGRHVHSPRKSFRHESTLRGRGHQRAGASRRFAHGPRSGRDAGLHARRHASHGQVAVVGRSGGAGGAHHSRQYLPLGHAAWPRAHWAHGRPAQVHGMAARHSDRFGGISGLQPEWSAHHRRGRRDLPVPRRW